MSEPDFLDSILTAFDSREQNKAKEDQVLEPLIEEIILIEDESTRDFVRSMLYHAPAVFWEMPANDREEENPPDEYVVGGNILHIKRVVRIVHQLAIAQEFDETETDILIAAALLHTVTRGMETRTGVVIDPFHPYTLDRVVNHRRLLDEQDSSDVCSSTIWIKEDVLEQILRLVRCQSGIWSPIPETIPLDSLEWCFHFGVLIASNLHIMVDGYDIKTWRWVPAPEES